MNTQQLEQVACFLEGTQPLTLAFSSQQAAYWIQRTLKHLGYKHCNKTDKGLLRRYITRLISKAIDNHS